MLFRIEKCHMFEILAHIFYVNPGFYVTSKSMVYVNIDFVLLNTIDDFGLYCVSLLYRERVRIL